MVNILLVSNNKRNEESFSEIEKLLKKSNYSIFKAFGVEKTMKLAESNNFDIVIMDYVTSPYNSIELCKSLRDKEIISFIIFISFIDDVEKKIEAFEAGAVDYLVRPIDDRELKIRLKTILKRSKGQQEIFKLDDLTLNASTRVVKRGGRLLDLTVKEYLLLEFLLRNKGKIVTRSEISRSVWGVDFDMETNVIDVYIKYVREKLKIDENSNQLIQTVYGSGYTMKLLEKEQDNSTK